jgi:ABC-type multidrug transport system fused ATPase/permease subunit
MASRPSSPPPSPLKGLLLGSWESTIGARLRFAAFVFLFIISTLSQLLVPFAIGYTFATLTTRGFSEEAFADSLWGVAAYTALRLLNTFSHHIARYLQTTTAYCSRMYTLNRIFASLMKFPLSWHIGTHSGDNLSKLNRAAGAIDQMIGTYVWQILEGVIKLVVASSYLFALDPKVACTVIFMSIITVLSMIYFNKRLADAIRRNNSFANKINRICVDYLFHVVTVKTLALEGSATQYLQKQQDEGYENAKRISRFSELKWGSTSVGYSLVIGTSLLMYLYGHRDPSQPFNVQEAYVLLDYLDKVFQAIGSFTAYYGGIIESSVAYEDGHSVIYQAAAMKPPEVAEEFDPSWSNLAIDDLTFSYATGEHSGLQGLSLAIKRGEKIALVGPSGGGKSTLLKNLGGLLVPSSYRMSTDKQTQILIEDIARQTLLVPQEPEIFSETLLYNLTMGQEFSSQDIQRFVGLARLHKVIEKLENGIESDLAENGLNLSVGEKQRVALARGLLRAESRAILLLDEPTSSLDPRTEKEIFIGILSHFSERTIAAAVHRLNLVQLFDKIVYVAAGKVEEFGAFDELIQRRGAFYRAWEDYERKVGG